MWLIKRFITTLPNILGSSQISRRARDQNQMLSSQEQIVSAEDHAALTAGTDPLKADTLNRRWRGDIYLLRVLFSFQCSSA